MLDAVQILLPSRDRVYLAAMLAQLNVLKQNHRDDGFSQSDEDLGEGVFEGYMGC